MGYVSSAHQAQNQFYDSEYDNKVFGFQGYRQKYNTQFIVGEQHPVSEQNAVNGP